MNLYKNIAIRSLNQVKTLNPIMYLSIKCFFEDFSNLSIHNDLFNDFIERKLQVRKDWSTKRNKLYKEKKDNTFIYRDTLSLSAFGIVAESYLMRLISKNQCIKNKEFVYSYSLPSYENSTRNFKYYFNGFKKRNEDILNILNSDENLISVVLDLTKFYPSINIDNAKELFFKEIKENSEERTYSLVKNITNSILKQSIKGIPIGMDLSHLIAQVYLGTFDKSLNEKYPSRYFRYVDDIIIICDKSEEENVKSYVSSQLPSELKINEEKTDKLNGFEWALLNKNNDKEEGNLNEVLNFITAYISMHPTKIDSLEEDIKELGYNIPLSRIKKQAKSKGYMSFIKSLINNQKRYSPFEIYFTKNKHIVQQLVNLQKFYLIRLNKLLELNYDNSSSAENRGNTQQLKFSVNRLLYLSTVKELVRIKDALPQTEKFEDTKEVINALSSKDLTNAIQYGGKVIQTICELWTENEFPILIFEKSNLIKIQNINNVIDSIIILALHKVIKFEIKNILNLLDSYNKEYIQVVLCDDYVILNKQDDFLVELQGLFQNRSLNEKYNLLTTRYDNDESIQLSGLDLGIAYYV